MSYTKSLLDPYVKVIECREAYNTIASAVQDRKECKLFLSAEKGSGVSHLLTTIEMKNQDTFFLICGSKFVNNILFEGKKRREKYSHLNLKMRAYNTSEAVCDMEIFHVIKNFDGLPFSPYLEGEWKDYLEKNQRILLTSNVSMNDLRPELKNLTGMYTEISIQPLSLASKKEIVEAFCRFYSLQVDPKQIEYLLGSGKEIDEIKEILWGKIYDKKWRKVQIDHVRN